LAVSGALACRQADDSIRVAWRRALAFNFLKSGWKWCGAAGFLRKMFHVKRFLVHENESRIGGKKIGGEGN